MKTIYTAAMIALLLGGWASPTAAVAQNGRGPSPVASDSFAWSDASEPVAVTLPMVQTPPRSYRRTWAGVGLGTTVAAIFLTSDQFHEIMGNCTGSGDIYLTFCRIGFVGGTMVGGGVGALIGRSVQSGTPAGRATPALVGSAIGAWATFLVSIPACGSNDGDGHNPALLCGFSGMPKTSAMLGGAAAGGLVGLLLAPTGNNVRLDQLGLVTTPENRRAVQVAFSFSGGS